MACMSGFYKRLKEIFSLSGDNKSSGACGCATVTSCCIGMPHASGNCSNVEALTVNVNPYAPIEEIELKVACLDGKNERRGKGTMGRFNGSRICRVLRFKSCSKESSAEHEFEASAPTVSRSGSTELYNLEKSPTTVSCDNRYKRDFQELDLVGAGEFGSVYRCVHRLDGRVYAVKRSRALDKGNYWRRLAINEVHANAVLNNHPNVVRYYGAWLEDERMSIQQEFCSGGDLAKLILGMRRDESFFEEQEICRILVHVATGLRYIHGSQLAHMDIKPENIFISREQIWTTKEERTDDLVKDEGCCREEIVYKIGDLGHVTGIADTVELEDEGDCRYLSKEVLREDYTDLAKADVFALGLTVYEAGGGGPLPKNGPAWHEIREGKLRRLMRYSEELNQLLMAMIHLNPQRRPSAHDIVQQNFYSIRQYSK